MITGPRKTVVTIRLRLRDRHSKVLAKQARAVNFVWNYCNDIQRRSVRDGRKWSTYLSLQGLTSGSSRELGLHAHTIQRVCRAYDAARRAKNRAWLKWRSRKSLGWVPFNTGHVRFDGSSFHFHGESFEPMHLRDEIQAGMRFAAGSFNSDALGRWYINIPVGVECAPADYAKAVGVDLGLTTLATLSDGGKIQAPAYYRASELALATAARAKKSRRLTRIHMTARNRRRDFLHKVSRAISSEYGTIVVGDVSPSRLAKTHMAKSVHDAGWAGFKDMLSYKAIRHGGRCIEVSEAMTTQTCSSCGAAPASRPKGIAGLRIRAWSCDDCGAVHDRDVNAALNILRIGLDTLVEGTLP
ncbi:RNA-guided endonuclease InsQ/TnpB family protein [Bosea sp. 2YAB26]|uniref:RNA-guided endonuclease InsQ/TnpB family protein n=1 Tax=Bosea sp. 2YAB26 TaxID=3237478 RepID=UPI003F936EE5